MGHTFIHSFIQQHSLSAYSIQVLWLLHETSNICGPCANGAYGLAAETDVIDNITQSVPQDQG